MAEKKKGGSKITKSILVSILVPIMIIVLIAGIFVAIIDAIVGIITGVVTAIANLIKHPWQTLQAVGGTISNAWNKFWNNDDFSPSEYIKEQISDTKVFIPLDQYNSMVEQLDASINRETAGLDNITIKKMLLTYYRSIYLSNTTILIELEDGEEKSIEKPFAYKKEKETEDSDEKNYLYIQGAISIVITDKDKNDSKIVTYTTQGFNEIYEKEYVNAINDGKNEYAEAVKDYLTKICTIEGRTIKMHNFDENKTETKYYYGDKFMGASEESNEDVHSIITLDYTNQISQYSTPVEFMTNLMTISGSRHFINEFMKMAIETGETKFKIYETYNKTKTETTEEYTQKAKITGEKPQVKYTAGIPTTENGKTVFKEVQSIEEQIEGQDKINLKVVNNTENQATIYLLKNGQKVLLASGGGYTYYKSIILESGKEGTFSDLDKPSLEEKIKEDSNTAKKVTITTTKENGYDIGLLSIDNWYLKSQQGNNSMIQEIYYTKNDDGEEILIDSTSDARKTTEAPRAMEEYTSISNPNIFTREKGIDWPIASQNDANSKGNEIIGKLDREGFLNIIFNYAIKKQEEDYDYNDYNFSKMNLSYESDISKTVLITKTKKSIEPQVPTVTENTDVFLALLSNESGKPGTGEPFKAKRSGGKAIEYDDLYNGKSKVGDLLENGLEPLCQILDTAYTSENICNTEGLSTVMRYIMYKYSGIDYGVTSLDFSIFGIGTLTQIASGNKLLIDYIHYWENGSGAPMNADGTKYIIHDDGFGHPTVGYGVDIENSGYKQSFIDNGYPIIIGGEVDVEFVDAIEKQILTGIVGQIKSVTSGINLTEYQINALVSRAYNCGISGALNILRGSPSLNFVDSYKNYWNQERDDKFEAKDSTADFTHSLYVQYMSAPTTSNGKYAAGLERRRKSEWTLFQTGYYDILDKWHSASGDIMRAAEEVHNQQTTWTYSVGGDLYWNNIEMSLNNPNKVTCCATYVSSVIYYAGFATEEQMNSFNYNACGSLYNYFSAAGWEIINSYDNLQPGDIVFMNYNDGGGAYDHVQLYAGDDTWYNAGATSAIQRSSPYSQGSWARQNFYVALRPVPIT